MKKIIPFLITTIVVIACAVCLYFCHKSGFLLEDGAESFFCAVGMLALPFAVSAIIGLKFDASIEGEDGDVELWKVSLGVCIAFVMLGRMIIKSTPKIISVDPKWITTAQIGLPMLINYIMCLWAIFRDPKSRKEHYNPPSAPPPPPPSTDDPNKYADAVGLASGRGIK